MIRAFSRLIALLSLLWFAPAMAQTFTVVSIGSANFNSIASASTGQTIFRANASTGSVTRVSGNAVRLSSAAVQSLVTVRCAGTAAACNNNARVVITFTGSPTGRLGALGTFTVAAGTASIAVAPGSGNSITFQLSPLGRNTNRTFWVGYDLPVNGDNTAGSTGAAASAFSVTISRTNGSVPNVLSGTTSATVYRSIAMTKTADMAFGRIVLPRSGSGTATLSPSSGTVSVSPGGMAAIGSGSSAATFSVTGEGGQTISFSVPSTITLTSGANSLTVTTSATASGAQTLSGTIGGAGSFPLGLGGSLPVTATTPSGTYTGTVSVTVAYN